MAGRPRPGCGSRWGRASSLWARAGWSPGSISHWALQGQPAAAAQQLSLPDCSPHSSWARTQRTRTQLPPATYRRAVPLPILEQRLHGRSASSTLPSAISYIPTTVRPGRTPACRTTRSVGVVLYMRLNNTNCADDDHATRLDQNDWPRVPLSLAALCCLKYLAVRSSTPQKRARRAQPPAASSKHRLLCELQPPASVGRPVGWLGWDCTVLAGVATRACHNTVRLGRSSCAAMHLRCM
jgi:hypothetical protein